MNLLKDEVSTLVRKLAIPASIGTLFQTLYQHFAVRGGGLRGNI